MVYFSASSQAAVFYGFEDITRSASGAVVVDDNTYALVITAENLIKKLDQIKNKL